MPAHAHVLFDLPHLPLPSWVSGVQLGGPVTLEGTMSALYDGLRLGCLLCCLGAANALANPKRALRALPGALYELGVAVVVSLSVAPQLVESVQRVRRARKLRGGDRARSPRPPQHRHPGHGGRPGAVAAAGRGHGLARVRPHRGGLPPSPTGDGRVAGHRHGRPVPRRLRSARQLRARPPRAAGPRGGIGAVLPRVGPRRPPGGRQPVPARPLEGTRVDRGRLRPRPGRGPRGRGRIRCLRPQPVGHSAGLALDAARTGPGHRRGRRGRSCSSPTGTGGNGQGCLAIVRRATGGHGCRRHPSRIDVPA